MDTQSFDIDPSREPQQERSLILSGSKELDTPPDPSGLAALNLKLDPQLEAALAEVGMGKVRIRRLNRARVVGSVFQKAGAIQIAVGTWGFSNQIREEVVNACRKNMRRNGISPDDFQVFANTLLEALRDSDSAMKETAKMIRTEEWREDADRDTGNNLPPKGRPIVGIAIMNTVTAPKAGG